MGNLMVGAKKNDFIDEFKSYLAQPLNRHFSYEELELYLGKKNLLSVREVIKYSDHLNNCRKCWLIWNIVRWDKAEGKGGYLELKEYLGNLFKEYFDSSWALAEEWLGLEPKTKKEIASFYKKTTNYLYNLVIWYESGDRYNFTNDFENIRDRFKVKSLIDYGCGVGNDGLALMEKDLKVYFVDYDCPSVEFLKWRLLRRGLKADVLDVEKIGELPPGDMFLAIDVLEHMVDPMLVVDLLSDKTRVFAHRSEFGNKAGGRHPCHFDFDEYRLGEALKFKGFKHLPWPVLSVWVRE